MANGEIRTVNLDIVRSEGTRTNEPQTVGYSRKADHAKPVILIPSSGACGYGSLLASLARGALA